MTSQIEKTLKTTDLQNVLYNCYEILKDNEDKMSLAELSVEYFAISGRNLTKIATFYECKSLAVFLEKIPDIAVNVDTKTKEVYVNVIDGGLQRSTFRRIKRNQVRL